MIIIFHTPKTVTERFIGLLIAIIPEESNVIIIIFSLVLITHRLDPIAYHVIIEQTPRFSVETQMI
jgi:hypothetical protein